MRHTCILFFSLSLALGLPGCGDPDSLQSLPAPLPESVYVSGRIYSQSEEAFVNGATVEVEETGLMTATNALGEFDLGQLEPGQYEIRIQTPDSFLSQMETIPSTEHLELTYNLGENGNNARTYLYSEGPHWFLRKTTTFRRYDSAILANQTEYTDRQNPSWHPLKPDTLLFTAFKDNPARRDVFEADISAECTLNCVQPLFESRQQRSVRQAQYSADGQSLYLLFEDGELGVTPIAYPATSSFAVLPSVGRLNFKVLGRDGHLRPFSEGERLAEIAAAQGGNSPIVDFNPALCEAHIEEFRIHHRRSLLAFTARAIDPSVPRTFVCGQPPDTPQVFSMSLASLIGVSRTTPTLARQVAYLESKPSRLAFSPDGNLLYANFQSAPQRHAIRGLVLAAENQLQEPVVAARSTPYEYDIHPFAEEILYTDISEKLDATHGFTQYFTQSLNRGNASDPKLVSSFHYPADLGKPRYYRLP